MIYIHLYSPESD